MRQKKINGRILFHVIIIEEKNDYREKNEFELKKKLLIR